MYSSCLHIYDEKKMHFLKFFCNPRRNSEVCYHVTCKPVPALAGRAVGDEVYHFQGSVLLLYLLHEHFQEYESHWEGVF